MTPQQIDDLKRFEFQSIESVSHYEWTEIRKRVTGHAKRVLVEMNCTTMRADFLAESVVASVTNGRREWDQRKHPNLLQFMFMATTSIVEATAGRRWEPPAPPGVRTEPEHRRRRRQRGSGILRDALACNTMNVSDVIQNLPMIALLVGRLNDLLNPVRPADASPEAQVVGQ